MAKAQAIDLIERGFRAEQFGAPADFQQPDGYLDRVLSDAAVIVRVRVGASVYDDAQPGSYLDTAVRNAELSMAMAELWQRRKVFTDSNARTANQEGIGALLREIREQSAASRTLADYWIGEAQRASGGVPDMSGTGSSFGHIETGAFAPVSAGRLN